MPKPKMFGIQMFNRSTDYIEPEEVKRQTIEKPSIKTDLSANRNQSIEASQPPSNLSEQRPRTGSLISLQNNDYFPAAQAIDQSVAKDSLGANSNRTGNLESESLKTDKSPADFAHLVTIKAKQMASIVSDKQGSDPGVLISSQEYQRENTTFIQHRRQITQYDLKDSTDSPTRHNRAQS